MGLFGKEKTSYKGRRRLLRIRLSICFIWVAVLLASSVAIAVVGVPQKWSEFIFNNNSNKAQAEESVKPDLEKQEEIKSLAEPKVEASDNIVVKEEKTADNTDINKKPTEDSTPLNVTASFEDCAFIGNSITQSLKLFNLAKGADIFADRGIMVSHFDSKAFIKTPKGKITIKQALDKKKYKKVYVMLGMNEAGWSYENLFVKKYGELIDGIKKSQPDAKIFIQSVLPVTAEKSAKDKIYNNEKVNRYNTLLKDLAEEKEVTYLDVASAVSDEDGALKKDASKDGVHLLKPYCEIWVDYLAKNS